MKMRVAAMILVLSFLVCICMGGCAQEERKPETIRPENVYGKEKIPLDDSFFPTTKIQIEKDRLYICGTYTGGSGEENSVCVAAVDIGSGAAEAEYTFLSVSHTPISFCVTENGYAVLQNYYEQAANRSVYILSVCSESGEVLYENDLSTYFSADDEIFEICAINSKIYVLSGENCVMLSSFDEGGADEIQSILLPGKMLSVYTGEDSSTCIFLESRTGERGVYRIDDADTLSEYTTSINWRNTYAEKVYMQSEPDFYVSNDEGILRCQANGDTALLLNWFNSGLSRELISSFAIDDENTFYMYGRTISDNSAALWKLTRVADADLPSKTVVTVSYAESGSRIIPRAAMLFNAISEQYYVVCEEYATVFAETEEYATQLSAFDKMLLKEDSGDVIVFSSSYDQYIEKDILCDLYDFIKHDEAFSEDSLFACVLESLEYKDRLCVLTPGFKIKTLMGRADVIGDEAWTFSAMRNLESSLTDGKEIMQAMNQNNMVDILLYYGLESFIDTENQICDFETEEFIELLTYLKALPESTDLPYRINDVTPYRSGKYLLYYASIGSFADFLSIYARFGFDTEVVNYGYPSKKGGLSVLQMNQYYAISQSSLVPDGAWEFVKFLLSEDVVLKIGDSHSYIPVLHEVFTSWTVEEMKYAYIFDDGSADFIPISVSDESAASSSAVYVTEDVIGEFQEFVETLHTGSATFPAIIEIVREEVSAFLAGAKTAEETAKVIQSRVSLYLGEQG